MAKVIHVHIAGIEEAPDENTVVLSLSIKVADGNAQVVTDSLAPSITLKILGVYRTAIQINQKVMAEAKAFVEDTYSIPSNSYAAEYLSGGYGLLNLV